MPRKKVDLSVVPIVPGAQRLEVPATLAAAEALAWVDYVTSMPAGWFNRASGRLMQRLCTLTATSDALAREIAEERAAHEKMTPLLRQLITEHREETKLMNSLCITLRLTPRSRYSVKDTEVAMRKQSSTTFRPWEVR